MSTVCGDLYFAIRGKVKDLKALVPLVQTWWENNHGNDEDEFEEELCWCTESFLSELKSRFTLPEEWEEMSQEERGDYTRDYALMCELPDDTIAVFSPDDDGAYVFCEDEPPDLLTDLLDCLDEMSHTLPDLEIAAAVVQHYFICGHTLHTYYSPAGAARLSSENWTGDWLSNDCCTASWENDFVKETGWPDHVQTAFPKTLGWFNLDIENFNDCDYSNDEE